MKNLLKVALSALLMFSVVNGNAQEIQDIHDIGLAPGRVLTHDAPMNAQRDTEIWSEDFSNGIPADWTNESTTEPAAWEYRGPSTEPGINVGTRGSCLPAGVDFGSPILSPTIENGFVIFDSNYWDDPIGPCGSFGTGEAPGPHFATLTTPSIDLSTYEAVGISFNQYHKNYQAESYIQASVDGGEWVTVWENDVPINNGESALDRAERKNISSIVGGEDDVRLRFVFDGNYYFWMLDDITLFELDDNNLVLRNAGYGDFDFENPDNETGFEYLEYSQYPQEMTPTLKFNGMVLNYGSQDQTNVTLRAKVFDIDQSTELASLDADSLTLAPEDEITFRSGSFDLPDVIGRYPIVLQALQDEEEASPIDNIYGTHVDVTDAVYTRDRQETDAIYIPPGNFNGDTYEVGNMFVVTAENQECHSVSAALAIGTEPDATVYAAIYKVSVSGGFNTELVAQTSSIPVETSAFNNFGDNRAMVIPFDTPVTMLKDSAYWVVAGSEDGPSQVLFPQSGESPELTSYVRFFPNTWFYMVNTPMVRMNFDVVTSVEEEEVDPIDLNLYPNPAKENVTLSFSHYSDDLTRVMVYNAMGQAVKHRVLGQLPRGQNLASIWIDDLAPGTYSVVVQTGDRKSTKLLIKE